MSAVNCSYLSQASAYLSSTNLSSAYSTISTVVRSSLDFIASFSERQSTNSTQVPWKAVGLVALAATSGSSRAQFDQIAVAKQGRLRAVGNQANVCFTMVSDTNDLINAATWIGGNEWFQRSGMSWLASESMSIASVTGTGTPYVSVEPHASVCHTVIAYWMDGGGWIQIGPPTLQSGCSMRPSNVKTALSSLPANITGDTGYTALWQNDHSDGGPSTIHAARGSITQSSNVNAIYVGPFELGKGIEPSVFDSFFAILHEARHTVIVGELDAYHPSSIKKILDALPRTFFYIHNPQILKTSDPSIVFLTYETAPKPDGLTRSIDGAFVNIIDGTVHYAFQIAGSQNDDGIVYHSHSTDYFASEGYSVTYRVGDRFEGLSVNEYGEKSPTFIINQTPISFAGRALTALFLSDSTRACSAWETSNSTVTRRVWPVVHRPPTGRTTYPPTTLEIPQPLEASSATATEILATTTGMLDLNNVPSEESSKSPSSQSNTASLSPNSSVAPTMNLIPPPSSNNIKVIAGAVSSVVAIIFLASGGVVAVWFAKRRSKSISKTKPTSLTALGGNASNDRTNALKQVDSAFSTSPQQHAEHQYARADSISQQTILPPAPSTANALPQVSHDSRPNSATYAVVPNDASAPINSSSTHAYTGSEQPMNPERVYIGADEPLPQPHIEYGQLQPDALPKSTILYSGLPPEQT